MTGQDGTGQWRGTGDIGRDRGNVTRDAGQEERGQGTWGRGQGQDRRHNKEHDNLSLCRHINAPPTRWRGGSAYGVSVVVALRHMHASRPLDIWLAVCNCDGIVVGAHMHAVAARPIFVTATIRMRE